MKKIYYEKQGRRYVPVSEYDSDYLDSFPKGNHLVMVYPGGSSRRFNIDPNYAAMIAAGRVAEDVMCRALTQASELKPSKKPLTARQLRAWQELAASFGDDMYTLQGVSTHDIVQAGVQAMQAEADKMLNNPVVRRAYDRFLLVAELARETTCE